MYGDFDPGIAVKNYKKDFNIISPGFREEWLLVDEDDELGVLGQSVYERGVKVEDLLGTQLANAPEDAEMLNIIWDSQVSDVGIVTCNCHKSMDELVYMVPKMCASGKNIFSSYLRRYTSSAQKALDNVFDQ